MMADQTPMVLLLDEADAIAKARDDANDVGELRRVVNSLLQGLDSLAPHRSLIILASNHSHLFDSAVWRRFDDVIEFPLPGQTARQMAGFTFAEIERAVMDVAKTKILDRSETVLVEAIVAEGKRWRRKMQAAAGTAKRRR